MLLLPISISLTFSLTYIFSLLHFLSFLHIQSLTFSHTLFPEISSLQGEQVADLTSQNKIFLD